MQSNRNLFLEKIAKRIQVYQLKIEWLAVVLFGILYVGSWFEIAIPKLISLSLFLPVAVMYYVLIFRELSNGASHIDRLLVRLNGMSYTIGVLALLFKFLHWTNALAMTWFSLISIFVTALLLSFLDKKQPEKKLFDQTELYRAMLIFILVSSTIFV